MALSVTPKSIETTIKDMQFMAESRIECLGLSDREAYAYWMGAFDSLSEITEVVLAEERDRLGL